MWYRKSHRQYFIPNKLMFYKSNALSWWFCKMFQESHYTHIMLIYMRCKFDEEFIDKTLFSMYFIFCTYDWCKIILIQFPSNKWGRNDNSALGFKLNSSCSQIDIWHQRYYIALLSKDITLDPQAIFKIWSRYYKLGWILLTNNCFSYRTV